MTLIKRFPAFLNETHATDIPCVQNFFSWKQNFNREVVYERLDRAVCNALFLNEFPNSILKYGPFTISDHAYTFMDSQFYDSHNFVRPFRFQNFWTLDKQSHDLVRKSLSTPITGSRFFRV